MTPPPLPPGIRPHRVPGVTLDSAGEHTVVRSRDGEQSYALNDTAAALWEICDGQTTREEMVAAVCALFDADPAGLAADVDQALLTMNSLGLLAME